MFELLLPILMKVGAPILEDVVKKNIGDGPALVVKTIAEKLGVPATPEAIEREYNDYPERTTTAIREVETSSPEMWAYYTNADNIRADILKRQDEQGGLASAWKWMWMYLLAFFWIWAIALVPIFNWIVRAGMPPVDLGTLMGLTSIYLGLYMGGHTVKDVATKWSGNKGQTGT